MSTRSASTVIPARPLWRSFLAFLAPMMLSNILQALSGTINNIYLGQMIGTAALASASVFFPILFFFIALIMGAGAGASVLIGQAWGAGERDRVKAIAATTMTAALGFGVFVAVAMTPSVRLVLVAFGTPANVLPGAIAYATVILSFMPVLVVFLLLTQLLRGVGDTVTPLKALAVSISIAMVLTPLLIRGRLGLPPLGVASAAWAGVASWTLTVAWMIWYLRRRDHPLAPDAVFLRAMWPDLSILKLVLRLGVPAAIQMVIMALAEMVLLGLVNRYGSDATAAYGAVNQVLAYVQFPAISVAITTSILSSQAIGAGRIESLPGILRTGMLFNLILTGALVLLAYLFSRSIVSLFLTTESVIGLTQSLLHIVLWSVVAYGAAGILSGQMRASGDVLIPTSLSALAIVLVEVPVAWIGSRMMGIDGIWIAYPLTFVAMLLFQATYYRLVWRHKTIIRLV
ncbi:MAG: MATE family efflux transporter [Janthinobacterium lividum]